MLILQPGKPKVTQIPRSKDGFLTRSSSTVCMCNSGWPGQDRRKQKSFSKTHEYPSAREGTNLCCELDQETIGEHFREESPLCKDHICPGMALPGTAESL